MLEAMKHWPYIIFTGDKSSGKTTILKNLLNVNYSINSTQKPIESFNIY